MVTAKGLNYPQLTLYMEQSYMIYIMKSPLALYRAFRAANVPDDIARDAAYAVSADLKAMIDQIVTEQDPDVANARIGLAGKSPSADA
ncbi:hypothetical protein HAP94_19100 [Acidithiobacillus ferrivorans]|nr:hypothetical protein [Acidithiobacillus ferrivorans]